MNCYARIDAKGTSYLLGDMSGHLLMLLLITEENADGTITVKKPKVEVLGMGKKKNERCDAFVGFVNRIWTCDF